MAESKVAPITNDSTDDDVIAFTFAKSDELAQDAPKLAASLRVVGDRLRRLHGLATIRNHKPIEEPAPEPAVPAPPKAKRKRAAK
jgi:hypothetical protein